jgi:hypothetical protein
MQSFDGKCDGNRPLERLGLRWEDNIKVDLEVIGWVGEVWIGLIWFRKGAVGWLLRTLSWNFGFHKMAGIL